MESLRHRNLLPQINPSGLVSQHDDETKERAIALYLSGLSAREVSKKLIGERGTYVSPQTVARWLRELGRSRPAGELRSAEVGPGARRLYESGLNLSQVARRCGVGKTTAAKRLREMGVSIRPSGARFLHALTKERLHLLYVDRGWSASEIASEVE